MPLYGGGGGIVSAISYIMHALLFVAKPTMIIHTNMNPNWALLISRGALNSL